MKRSKYNYFVDIGNNKRILYNTLTRKYIVYRESDQNMIDLLLTNLKKKEFTLKEVEFLNNLIANGMVIDDELDELEKIKFDEQKAMFQDQKFYLTIQPTLDCNFRCIYCYEEHKKVAMNDSTAEKLIKFVQNITEKIPALNVIWFGGEPLLEFNRIVELTSDFKKICSENNCKYSASIVSNGYLFNDISISRLEYLSIKLVQITLDGIKTVHDKQRHLENGESTFDKIKENIMKILDKNLEVTLRINVSDENFEHITELFDIIPLDKRDKVNISICNLYSNNGRISLFNLYKNAIQKGYRYFNTHNKLLKCQTCCKNAFTIEPDGALVLCSVASEDGCKLGEISNSGKAIIKNKATFYKLKNITALDNERCRECIQLPICMGGCKYSRYKNKNICNGLRPDGLSLEEKIKLHYYNDLKTFQEADAVEG